MAASTSLQLGMVGLGRMGANLVRRAMRDGHRCVGTDVSVDAIRALEGEGMAGAASAAELVEALEAAPHGLGDGARGTITGARDRRARPRSSSRATRSSTAATRATTTTSAGSRVRRLVDSTTSTSARAAVVFGLERGFCLMIGGETGIVARLAPLFTVARRRASGCVERTPGRRRSRCRRSSAGSTAARRSPGHFVKMVHNGIEYGLMAAYAEGLDILHHANAGATRP
jgi:6-phosphogluconate dehydrogenase